MLLLSRLQDQLGIFRNGEPDSGASLNTDKPSRLLDRRTIMMGIPLHADRKERSSGRLDRHRSYLCKVTEANPALLLDDPPAADRDKGNDRPHRHDAGIVSVRTEFHVHAVPHDSGCILRSKLRPLDAEVSACRIRPAYIVTLHDHMPLGREISTSGQQQNRQDQKRSDGLRQLHEAARLDQGIRGQVAADDVAWHDGSAGTAAARAGTDMRVPRSVRISRRPQRSRSTRARSIISCLPSR